MKKLLTLLCLITVCVISNQSLVVAQSDTCNTPTNPTSSNITATSVKLSWDAVPGAVGYKVRYREAGDTSWTTKKITTGKSRQVNHLSPETNYIWEVKTYCTINPGFSSAWTSRQKFTTLPARLSEPADQISFDIYPNPVHAQATIHFTLSQSSDVNIAVYDLSGRQTTLLNGNVEQGDHSLQLNTNQFSDGVYFLKIITDSGTESQKFIVQ